MSFSKCSRWAWKECVVSSFGMSINQARSIFPVFLLVLSAWAPNRSERWCNSLRWIYWFINFPFYCYFCLTYIWGSVIRQVHMHSEWLTLWKDSFFNHCAATSLIPNDLWPEVCFVRRSLHYTLDSICQVCLFPPVSIRVWWQNTEPFQLFKFQ